MERRPDESCVEPDDRSTDKFNNSYIGRGRARRVQDDIAVDDLDNHVGHGHRRAKQATANG